MTLAVIALGANIDSPIEQLKTARDAINQLPNLSDTHLSRVYSSPPMGPQNQPPFFNAVMTCHYTADANQLLAELQRIEVNMGRVKRRRWGERCIDLDIIQLGDVVIETAHLSLPHPGIAERLFVVQPMIDLLGCQHKVPGLDDLGTLRRRLTNQSLTLCQDVEL